MSRLKLVDGVRWVISYYGSLLAATLYYDGERALERWIRLISSISGLVLSWYEVPFPHCGIKLSKTDWNLVKSLRKDPRKNYSALAEEVHVSVRTVRRRVARMIDARAFFLETVLDLKKLKGSVFCHLRVYPAESRRRDELQRAVLSKVDNVVWANIDLPVQTFMIVCNSIGEVNEILKRVRAIEGVKEARADVPEERLTVHEWLDEQIDRKLREASKRNEVAMIQS